VRHRLRGVRHPADARRRQVAGDAIAEHLVLGNAGAFGVVVCLRVLGGRRFLGRGALGWTVSALAAAASAIAK
jgi:hypothetical protein